MHPLVAIGGFRLEADRVRTVEMALDALCKTTGFPPGERFKWSPQKDMWMRANLTGAARREFFLAVVRVLAENNAQVTVVLTDTKCSPATRAATPESDVTTMFIERAHIQLTEAAKDGIVIVERPGGGRTDEDHFLSSCMDVIQAGTDYVRPERFALNVISTSAKFCRCLQAADVVTSAVTANVSGEMTYSRPIFDEIKPLFRSNCGSIGGTGLKLHPDARYMNLYHWILGDTYYVWGNSGKPLPIVGQRYEKDDGL